MREISMEARTNLFQLIGYCSSAKFILSLNKKNKVASVEKRWLKSLCELSEKLERSLKDA